MQASPLISVIVPVYNVAAYLPRCLDSIVGQTYKNLEIILINDGSTDNSPQICEEYTAKDKRVHVFHQKNQGVSAARNAGLDHARGEFITFVDPDDWLDRNAIDAYLQAIEQTGADMAWGHYVCVAEKKLSVFGEEPYSDSLQTLTAEEWAFTLIARKDFSSCNKLFSRDLIHKRRFVPRYTQGEDLAFLATLFSQINKVVYTPQTVYFYLQRGTSAGKKPSIQQHRYNQEIGQLLYDACTQQGFQKARTAALSVLLLSTSLYGIYILLLDSENKYQKELTNVWTLFNKHRYFIFHNRVMWQPAKFCIQIWVLFPTFTKWICRLPGVNAILRYLLAQKLKSVR